MERIGIIDLGSNSVRLVIVEVDDHGAYYQRENQRDSSTNCRYRREWYSVRKSNALCNRNDPIIYPSLQGAAR